MNLENSPLVTDEAIRDQRVLSSRPSFTDVDYEGHRAEVTYDGLQIPGVRRRGHHRRHRHNNNPRRPELDNLAQPNVEQRPITPPSQRVQFILGEDEDESRPTHPLFSEMEELQGQGDNMEWRETARWVKFEEDVEEGGNRWSKPHVATLGLHSLLELRSCILHGAIVLDFKANTLDQIADKVLDVLISNNQLPPDLRGKLREILLKRHRHQHEKHNKMESLGSRLPLIRSLAEIGRNASKPIVHHSSNNQASNHHDHMNGSPSVHSLPVGQGNEANASCNRSNERGHPESNSSSSHIHCNNSNSRNMNNNHECNSSTTDVPSKGNHHFMKKLPAGSEASNILVGQLNVLERSIIAFVRLSTAELLGDLTEVPLPTRFIFILLGPRNPTKYHHIGRAMATLMCDEVFHDVAYKARNRQDLLSGFDEFLDSVTVLPPGEWDPSIRIEPPQFVPSQQSRKMNNKSEVKIDPKEEEEKELMQSGLKRTGKFFGGFINDIKRKKPWYLSDFKDAVAVQCLASFFFIYFACLTPIITFGGLLDKATNSQMAAMESLLSGAIVGVTYSIFSGQPLTILGSTGPVLVFEATVFNISESYQWDYLSFRLWIGLWTALILIILVAFDASAFVCYITRFTEENFATLISVIFIVKSIESLLHIQKENPVQLNPGILEDLSCNCSIKNSSYLYPSLDVPNLSKNECINFYNGTMKGAGCNPSNYVPDVFLMSVLLYIGTFVISVTLKNFKTASFFPTFVRQMVSDFAVILAIVSMTVTNYVVGLPLPTLDVPTEFKPTWSGRTWLIPPFGKNPWWSALVAAVPALLCTILIFMDQQITAVIVNRKENKLKKGCGYHLDLFIIAICIGICAVLGLPWFVAATVLSITHVNSLKVESETAAPGEKPHFLGVREQRVTHFLVFAMIGLSVLLTRVLHFIPMPVLYGVFLYMGTSSLKGSQFVDRILLMFMPQKYQPDYIYLRHVPTKRVHLFTIIQLACLAVLWGIESNPTVSILLPLMVAALIGVRKLLDFVFTQRELKILDDVMPESTKLKHEDDQKKKEKKHESQGLPVVDSGNVHIQLATGNVLKVPVNRLQQPNLQKSDDSTVNISEEMTKTGTWQNINQNSRDEYEGECGTSSGHASNRGGIKDAMNDEERRRLSVMNEDEEDDDDDDVGITINMNSSPPLPSKDSPADSESVV